VIHGAHRAGSPISQRGVSWRGYAPLHAALDETWKPWLDGRGTRDEALAALVAQTALSSSAPLFTFETDEFWLVTGQFTQTLEGWDARLWRSMAPPSYLMLGAVRLWF
jgi:hypothetical protein